jgi:hypothetical protein
MAPMISETQHKKNSYAGFIAVGVERLASPVLYVAWTVGKVSSSSPCDWYRRSCRDSGRQTL